MFGFNNPGISFLYADYATLLIYFLALIFHRSLLIEKKFDYSLFFTLFFAFLGAVGPLMDKGSSPFFLFADGLFLYFLSLAILEKPRKWGIYSGLFALIILALAAFFPLFISSGPLARIWLAFVATLALVASGIFVRKSRIEAMVFYMIFVFGQLGLVLLMGIQGNWPGLMATLSIVHLCLALIVIIIFLDRKSMATGSIKRTIYLIFITLLPMGTSLLLSANPAMPRISLQIGDDAVYIDGSRLGFALNVMAFFTSGTILAIALWEREKERLYREEVGKLAADLEKMSSLGRMAAGIAHEINNPLGLIVGNACLLLEEKSEENIEEIAQLIIDEGERCAKIVGNMLDFSREKPVIKGKVDFSQLLDRIMLLLGHPIKKKGVELKLQIQGLPLIAGDFQLLQQIMLNLLNNAIFAVDNGGIIWIIGQEVKDMIYIFVVDNGLGIKKEHKERIFEPFFTTKEPGQGTGLGLSICRSFAQAQGGILGFANKEDLESLKDIIEEKGIIKEENTTFILKMPKWE